MVTQIPYLQFRFDSLIQYNLIERDNFTKRFCQDRLTEILVEQTLNGGTYTGKLTAGAKKRLTRSIENMLQKTPARRVYNTVNNRYYNNFRIAFITLTFPDNNVIAAKDAHSKCLEPFLQWLRRSCGVQSYVWKAEHQMRGQLHYHIIVDQFIHHKLIRAKWADLAIKAGLMDEYYRKKNNYNAPCTEIKKVWKEKNLCMYIKKEFEKVYQNQNSVQGKVWDCSKNLKHNMFSTIYDNGYQDQLWRLVHQKEVVYKNTDHCTIYTFLNGSPASLLKGNDILEYKKLMAMTAETLALLPKPAKNVTPPPREVHKVTEFVKNKYRQLSKAIVKDYEKQVFISDSVFNPHNIFDFPAIYDPFDSKTGSITVRMDTFFPS